ncbi:MAG: transposase [Xenococcaceae cyanobacterium MO_188.B19]|nr:transposase [Xenococcaceae cyanobacterium MO_188.B19]MDJ0681223.1 transposase [Xenococcaceae cyanobacterium MO_167.B52]
MFVLEYKLRGKESQFRAIDEAIRTVQFVRNKCLRYWQDNRGVGQKDIYKHVTALRKEFSFVKDLNSTACQQACERTWTAILKFYNNCKNNIPGKKTGDINAWGFPRRRALGYPKYSKRTRSVEFKKSGWKLNRNAKKITFTDGKNIGELKLIGSRDLYYFQEWQIQRIRIVRRADGYFVQLMLKLDIRDITPQLEPTKKCVAIDVGLKYFYADSNGETIDCPKYYRKSEKRLNKLNRRKSRKFNKGRGLQGAEVNSAHSPSQKQSNNYIKARKKYAKKHLKVSRQREEFAKEKALRLIQSNDLVAYEDLKVKNLVRNKKLAKSINDTAWSLLRKWIEYFGLKYGRLTIAVPPHYTTSDCPSCGKRVKKSLSTRTHVCDCGIPVLDRDYAASLNILKKATQGHWGSWSEQLDLNAWGDRASILVGSNTCQGKLSQ